VSLPKKNRIPATREALKVDLKVALYDKLIATHPEIERKGAANPYTSVNGHMFTILHDSRSLAIRLPEEERGVFEEAQDHAVQGVRGHHERVRSGSRRIIEKYERTAEVSRIELRICQEAEAQTHQEEV
jgi:hypothetical protein